VQLRMSCASPRIISRRVQASLCSPSKGKILVRDTIDGSMLHNINNLICYILFDHLWPRDSSFNKLQNYPLATPLQTSCYAGVSIRRALSAGLSVYQDSVNYFAAASSLPACFCHCQSHPWQRYSSPMPTRLSVCAPVARGLPPATKAHQSSSRLVRSKAVRAHGAS